MKTALKVMVGTAAYAGIHSLLASRVVKYEVAKLVGERNRDAFYRFFYLVQSVAGLAVLYEFARRQPSRVLYTARGPLRLMMRAGQVAGVGFMAWAAHEVGFVKMLGLESLRSWRHEETVKEPEAQGPRADDGHMKSSGPFAWSRHPLNFGVLPIFWLNPTMKSSLLAFNVVATVYLVLGSIHEEMRLKTEYGEAYEEYLRSGIPFFIPRPVRKDDRDAELF